MALFIKEDRVTSWTWQVSSSRSMSHPGSEIDIVSVLGDSLIQVISFNSVAKKKGAVLMLNELIIDYAPFPLRGGTHIVSVCISNRLNCSFNSSFEASIQNSISIRVIFFKFFAIEYVIFLCPDKIMERCD